MSSGPMGTGIVRLDTPREAEISSPDPARLLTGQPVQRLSNYYADPSGQFFAGRWGATRGSWRVRYTEHELCVLTAGRVRLVADSGVAESFGPGDAFVIPAGFSGIWEVLEDCTKLYAIFEPRAG